MHAIAICRASKRGNGQTTGVAATHTMAIKSLLRKRNGEKVILQGSMHARASHAILYGRLTLAKLWLNGLMMSAEDPFIRDFKLYVVVHKRKKRNETKKYENNFQH